MEKTVLFVRHPSVRWTDGLLRKAEQEEKDIETYVPIDKQGMEMVKLLLVYLKANLPRILKRRPFKIHTSPLKRAKDMARIISKGLAEHLSVLEYFTEVPWINKKAEALAIVEEARQKRIHPVKLWLNKEELCSKILQKLNNHLLLIEQGLKYFEESTTPVNIVFSHRLTITLTLWLIQQKNKRRKNLTIIKDDLSDITTLTGKLAYTSISQIELSAKGWDIVSIGQVPHLEKEPKLIGGSF
ncbi:histidine phosphatase family protein [Patescibacteria group bacterium]|nr:histidine phosphatase family protein [Patescibacteria group bacterium]